MPLPNVTLVKKNGQTGTARPSATGILAIIACANAGSFNAPSSHTKNSLAYAEFGDGALAEYGAHIMSATQKQVLLVRANATGVGAYGTPVQTGAGTSVLAVNTATLKPFDDFQVLLTFVTGGTRGTAGITYTYSLDNGLTASAVQALGVATSITIPNSGVTIDLGAGTVLAGQTFAVTATGPTMANADLSAALEALRVSRASFEGILIAGTTDATMLATLQAWITAREAEGRFYHAYVNTRFRGAAETSAAFKTVLDGIYGAVAAPSVLVGADGGRIPSVLPGGRTFVRPVALAVAARAMAIQISKMPSYKADGPVSGWSITDSRDNLLFHDENAFPGLSDSRFTTFRSFNGSTGVYINLPLLFDAVGGDYVFLPHVRVMNRACDLVRQNLELQLSSDQRKGSNGRIVEEDAARIESSNAKILTKQIKEPGFCSDTGFLLSRTDDATSNAGVTLTCELGILPLLYVTGFNVEAKFITKAFSVAA